MEERLHESIKSVLDLTNDSTALSKCVLKVFLIMTNDLMKCGLG